MKKALLLMLGAITSYSSFAQIDTFYNTARGLSTNSVDTLQLLAYPAQYGSGYQAGMNDGADNSGTPNAANQVMGAAEAYTPTFDGTKSYKVSGILSVWVGKMNTVGSEKLTFHLWSVDDTHAGAYWTGSGMDSVAGFPGTVLASAQNSFADISPTLNTAHGPLTKGTVKRFYTPISLTEVSAPFFTGFTFDNAYTYGTPPDTIGVAVIQEPAGLIGPWPGHDDYVTHETGYDLYMSRNCVFQNNAWRDLYQDHGLHEFLALYPIVELDPLSVGSITKGGLTFSGAYPNPAINNTNIKFSLTKNADVIVEIMDMSGRVLNTIQQKGLTAGEHIVPVSTANMAAGNYLYTVTTSNGDGIGSKLTVTK